MAPGGERSWSTRILSFLAIVWIWGQFWAQGAKHRKSTASQLKHCEYTDIALVQLPAHIAITQPCTHYASQLKYCKHTAAYIKHRICTAMHTKHRKYTASQLKYYEYTAAYIKHRNYTALHTKHPKYTVTHHAGTASMQRC